MEVRFIGVKVSELPGSYIDPYRGDDRKKGTIYGLFVWVNRKYLRVEYG